MGQNLCFDRQYPVIVAPTCLVKVLLNCSAGININKKAAILPLKQIFKPLRKKGCRVLIQRDSLF